MTAAEKRLMRAMARALRKREQSSRDTGRVWPNKKEESDAMALALCWAADDIERIVDANYFSEKERHAEYVEWLRKAEK